MTETAKGPGHNADPRGLRRWRYVLKKQVFEELGDGTVRVTCDDGRVGLFKTDGSYISGDLTQASMQMIVWVSDPKLPLEVDLRWPMFPVDIDRPSGFPEAVEKVLHYQLGDPAPTK